MKKTITQWLYMDFDWVENYNSKAWQPRVRHYKITDDDESRVYVGPMEIEVNIPNDFDPTPSLVAALEKKKLAALAEYQATVAEINKRLSELQAITA